MEFYVVKSGMQMYDLSRAYGLSLILQKLSNSVIKVKDLGIYYLIESDFPPRIEKIWELPSLLPEETNPKWSYMFLTLKRKQRNQEIKNCKELIKEQKIIQSILQKYKNIRQPEFFKSKKGKTLYQSMDLSATKGFRENLRGKVYHEGSQLYIPTEDFLLSVIGHLNFTVWKWKIKKPRQLIMILFSLSKEGIRIGKSPDAKNISKDISEKLRFHCGGVLPTLCYSAVLLGKEISEVKEREVLKFSSLLFGVMNESGQQWKPFSGGIYPLDFLYRIISSSERVGEIFDKWIEILRITNKPGYEDLARCLTEFITYPSQRTLEEYLKSHLHTFLNKKKLLKLYEIESMREVLKSV